jgi:calmodulin
MFSLFSSSKSVTRVKAPENHAAAFAEADKNKDGRLDATELAAGFGLTVPEAEAAIAYFDVDADKAMNLPEFSSFCHILLAESSSDIYTSVAPAFKKFDGNGDGKLSKVELKGVQRSFGLADKEFDEILQRCDLNHDGKLDVREFLLFVTRLNEESAKHAAVKEVDEGAGGVPPIVIAAVVAAVIAGAAFFVMKQQKRK